MDEYIWEQVIGNVVEFENDLSCNVYFIIYNREAQHLFIFEEGKSIL